VNQKPQLASDTNLDWEHDPSDPEEIAPQTMGRFAVEVCNPFPHHVDLAAVFTGAGFKVIRVEKLWCAHVWEVAMERGTSELPTEYRPAVRRLRTLLTGLRVPVERDSPTLRLSGNRVSLAFRWREGAVGAICRRRGGGWDTVRTPKYEPERSDEPEL